MSEQEEREPWLEQLDMLRESWAAHTARRERSLDDVKLLNQSLGLFPAKGREEFSQMGREEIQEKLTELRWNGEVDMARQVKAAWTRLEASGADDAFLLDRLCCLYGLIRMNSFNEAFRNVIRREESSGEVIWDRSNPFRSAAEFLLTNLPEMDIYYAFLGYEPKSGETGGGYARALARYLRLNLRSKYNTTLRKGVADGAGNESGNGSEVTNTSESRPFTLFSVDIDSPTDGILFQNAREVLYATPSPSTRYSPSLTRFLHIVQKDTEAGSASLPNGSPDFSVSSTSPLPPPPKYLPEASRDLQFLATLVLIASPNPYERQVQIPQLREREGIARRVSHLMGCSPENVHLRVLFLPPRYLDKTSLDQIHEMIGGRIFAPEFQQFQGQYDRELEDTDVDYREQRRALPQEDWICL